MILSAVLFAELLAGLSCAPSPTAPAAAPPSPATGAVGGSLIVLVRPQDHMIEPVPVSDPSALPVVSGGAMSIDVQLDEPAFIYLVWFDSEGQALPLYPWNNETLEVKDLNQPPPVRRATKRIFSPLIGRSWTFGTKPGTETLVLLARRTALPESVQINSLLASPPLPEFEQPHALIKVRLPGQDASKTADFLPAARPLATFLEPLAKHFDLIEAVQFAHADKKPD